MELLKKHLKFNIGCDPEFFLSKNGNIIGSEKAIPEEGFHNNYGKIIRDGIQCEINPNSATCRETLAYNIQDCFKQMINQMKITKFKTDFSQTVAITKKEMDSLSPQSKIFGCAPSFNAYTKTNEISIKDASSYMKRSAGGHIHLGTNNNIFTTTERKKLTPERLIPLLDILVGNTCVLLDRDEGNIERRKVYGKAGEFRIPTHGIEYRTLSNFWLNSYQLFSFATGMARYAVNTLINTTRKNPYEKTFLKAVKQENIINAINNNDFNLAYENFKKIEPIISEITPTKGTERGFYPLTKNNLKEFHYFVKKGIKKWFPEDPFKSWLKLGKNNIPLLGWNDFLQTTVRKKRKFLRNSSFLFN